MLISINLTIIKIIYSNCDHCMIYKFHDYYYFSLEFSPLKFKSNLMRGKHVFGPRCFLIHANNVLSDYAFPQLSSHREPRSARS